MAVIYIDSLTGSDTLGGGSAGSPFASIAHGVSIALPGDVIVVLGTNGHTHEEPDTVYVHNKFNIKIQTEPMRHVTVRPVSTSKQATFMIEGSDGINISGLKFLSARPPETNHAHAVLVKNSVNIKILGNEISEDWECHDVPATELFKCDNSSVELTGNFCNYVENSFPSVNNPNNFFSFISVSGNGDYLIRNNAIKNVHSNSGFSYGIKVYADTGKFKIDDFEANDFIPEHTDYHDKMIGIYIEGDNSAAVYEISNCILNKLGYGIYFKHMLVSLTSIVRRLLITNCVFSAICLDDESVVYDIRHATIAKCYEGVYTKNKSAASITNSIIYNCDIGLRADLESYLRALYSVHYFCTQPRFTSTKSIIDASQFVRNIDPKFVNESQENYNLTDYSPCVDTGSYYASESYLGNGPDIGFYEKTALVTEDELPSLLARATRLTERVPLTEIDIIGMVARGIETSDGRIMASREGSAVKDLAVKPLDLIITPYHTELELIRDRLAFSRLENLSEQDADLLASNVFVERDYGTYASGIVRIFFSEPRDAILYSEHEFKTQYGLKFYTRATVAITKDEMALNYDNGAYYFDTVVDAEVPSLEYNLPAGSITISTMPMPPGMLSFTNPYELAGGYPSETNYELKEKAQFSISVRDIVTKKGARATLPELFPFISDMRTIGYRDPEMERDFIALINDNIGGKSDIYIKTRLPVEDSKIIYPDSKFFEITDATFSGYVPILKITSIEMLEPVSEAETGIFLNPATQFKIVSRDKLHRFSVKEHIAIEFSDTVVADYMPNTPFKINFIWIPEMKALQSVILGDDERVIVADILARAFEPAYVSFSINYLAEAEIPSMAEALGGFIRGLRSGSELQESDLVAMAYSLGAQKVLQPMELQVEHHTREGKVNYIMSPDGVFLPRIATFWDGEITANYLGKEVTNA